MPGKPVNVNIIAPLDYLIMRELPIEGTMFADIYPIGTTVKAIVKAVTGGKMTSSQISTRMRLLNIGGYVLAVHSVGGSGTVQWQLTESGKRLLSEWEATQKGESENGSFSNETTS